MSTNELKRTRKHVASMAYAIGLTRGVVLTCRCGEWKRTGKHERPLREEHRAHRVEMGEWVKPCKEGPDWADVREAARAAGWRMVRDRSTVQMCWTIRNPDEDGWFIDKGWAVVTFDANSNRGRWLFEFAGPGPHRKSTACLVNPTPAEVLTAARLVGLGGGDER